MVNYIAKMSDVLRKIGEVVRAVHAVFDTHISFAPRRILRAMELMTRTLLQIQPGSSRRQDWYLLEFEEFAIIWQTKIWRTLIGWQAV